MGWASRTDIEYKVCVLQRKPPGKLPLEKPRRQMYKRSDVRETDFEDVMGLKWPRVERTLASFVTRVAEPSFFFCLLPLMIPCSPLKLIL
jgi:hypothetical protein